MTILNRDNNPYLLINTEDGKKFQINFASCSISKVDNGVLLKDSRTVHPVKFLLNGDAVVLYYKIDNADEPPSDDYTGNVEGLFQAMYFIQSKIKI